MRYPRGFWFGYTCDYRVDFLIAGCIIYSIAVFMHGHVILGDP
ncbi:hypothetical protein RchiOBHm_Chr5g0043521 [Rosa chinensis]|uniref:Uncharacterized protein n=1 Tax=Rosa chinensis TaxID=74649 RepID=A0A2P6QDC8_ROSCH|nr:hypothetical protein RchiOBHm_Chr5g0043521 [Rosa chinensis]